MHDFVVDSHKCHSGSSLNFACMITTSFLFGGLVAANGTASVKEKRLKPRLLRRKGFSLLIYIDTVSFQLPLLSELPFNLFPPKRKSPYFCNFLKFTSWRKDNVFLFAIA